MGRRCGKKTDVQSCGLTTGWGAFICREGSFLLLFGLGHCKSTLATQKDMSWAEFLWSTTLGSVISFLDTYFGCEKINKKPLSGVKEEWFGNILDLWYLCFLRTHFDVKHKICFLTTDHGCLRQMGAFPCVWNVRQKYSWLLKLFLRFPTVDTSILFWNYIRM